MKLLSLFYLYLYSYERNTLLTNQPNWNIRKATYLRKCIKILLVGERNDDPQKYRSQEKFFKHVQLFKAEL